MDKILGAQPLKVPVMLVHSLWDQEDIYGAIAVYKAIEPKDTNNDRVFLVMGPWHHGQEIGDGSSLGCRVASALSSCPPLMPGPRPPNALGSKARAPSCSPCPCAPRGER